MSHLVEQRRLMTADVNDGTVDNGKMYLEDVLR